MKIGGVDKDRSRPSFTYRPGAPRGPLLAANLRSVLPLSQCRVLHALFPPLSYLYKTCRDGKGWVSLADCAPQVAELSGSLQSTIHSDETNPLRPPGAEIYRYKSLRLTWIAISLCQSIVCE